MREAWRIYSKIKSPNPMCMTKPKYFSLSKFICFFANDIWIDAFKIRPHSLKIP